MSEEALNEINKRLDETFYELIDELKAENKQLQNNWNELKKWLESNHKYSEFAVWEILKQMQELENRKV